MYNTYAIGGVDFSKVSEHTSVSSLAATVPLPRDYIDY